MAVDGSEHRLTQTWISFFQFLIIFGETLTLDCFCRHNVLVNSLGSQFDWVLAKQRQWKKACKSLGSRGFFSLSQTGKMDAGIEKECSALGGLFQLIMNDMKVKTIFVTICILLI